MSLLLQKCIDAGLKVTEQRKVILKVLEDSTDHPSVETVCERAKAVDASVSIATVYRTLGLLDELGLVLKHGFGQDHARFEVTPEHDHDHHHHLIDTETDKVVEFQSEELEALIHKIADEHGYDLIDHTIELFGHKKKK